MNRERAKELLPLIEHFANGGDIGTYAQGISVITDNPSWSDAETYHIVYSKPSIDWSHVNKEYKWLAVDEDGKACVTVLEPREKKCFWVAEDPNSSAIPAEYFASFKRGTCDWEDSKIRRPERGPTFE